MQDKLAEAERRIEEARRTQAETLDLGDLALSELPASLGELPYLKALYLGKLKPTGEGDLGDPDREPPGLTDLSPLAGLPGLQRVSLFGCEDLTDLAPLAGLQALQRLDLGYCRNVTDLAPLAGLQALQSLKLSRTGVTDLAPLAGLQALQSLDLCQTGVTDLVPLAGLQALQSLDLYQTGATDLSPLAGSYGLRFLNLPSGVTDLSPLAGLYELESLYLGTGVTDLSPLAELHGLRSLSVPRGVTDLSIVARLHKLRNLSLTFSGVTDLGPVAGLQELQSLSFGYTKVTDLSPLAGLANLQNLDLDNCTGVTSLSAVAGLRRLRSLSFRETGVTDLSPLVGLQQLQRIELAQTDVTDLTPLAKLHNLQTLSFGSTNVTDLAPLAALRELRDLSFDSCGGISDLTPLAGLHRLQSLTCSLTGINDLSSLAGHIELRSLELSYSGGVKDLSPLAGLERLQRLSFRGTRVTSLAPLTGHKDLKTLRFGLTEVRDLYPLARFQVLQALELYDCKYPIPGILLRILAENSHLSDLIVDKAEGVPREVLSRSLLDNCLPRLRIYFFELDLGAEAENEVKVILLGNGRVGKTQLCRRFRGESYDESIPSTHGVQLWRKELRIRTGDQEQVFQVNWWDFGGQDIYHDTHALFLRSRAVFIILWTPKLENREEYEENGIPLRNQPLAYWLDYVRTLAGKDSPVIIVQSQCDRLTDRRPAPATLNDFRFIESCPYSAKEDVGREILEGQLRAAIRYLLEQNGALEIGKGRAEVRRRLYEWRSEDQEREPEERRHRTLTLDEFRELCEEAGGIVSLEHALDYFHNTGVVFYREDLFSNCIVLDQDWALEAIYTVFHRGRTVPWLRDSGRFTREDLAATIWQEHSEEEQRLFLGMMESCGVCFPCGKTDRGETQYVAPDLLPSFEGVAKRIYALWTERPATPTLRLEYRFFHPAVLRGLMSEIGRQAKDLAEYWKYGLWLKDGSRDSQLLVQFHDTSTNEGPGAGALELKAQGREPLGLLREIRKAILWQRIGEEPEELLTLDGATVARSVLANVIEGRVLDIEKKPVTAARFAAFFEDREQLSEEVLASKEPTGIDINPQPLTASEKPREVFISYAWGDDTPEGKKRAEVVDELYTALETDGFRPVRDRDEMRPGERISAFMRRLTRADLVVAVISEKYLRSTYCMYEIYKLWQRCQGDADELVERLVPVVLPEVRIGSVLERVPYSEHWRAQQERLEALDPKMIFNLSPDSFQEVRLVREFAHHVDDILVFLQDVLMPRKLEAHLDDGFQAVRDALRRKILTL